MNISKVLILILKAVAKVTDVPVQAIIEKGRKKEFVVPKHLFRYFAKKYTNYSLQAIADVTKNTHATTLHSIKAMNDILDTKEEPYYSDYIAIDRTLKRELVGHEYFFEEAGLYMDTLKGERNQIKFYTKLVEEYTRCLIDARAVELNITKTEV